MRDLVQFDVLISCPSDIENRGFINTIKDIVYNFNTNYGFKIGVSIRILYWKDSSYPEYGDTPQDIINRQIVDNADAVIAVFGNVFGTATSRYGSGTEEEIEKMIQQYDIVNDLGIKCVHYQLALNVLAKIAILSLVCFWR